MLLVFDIGNTNITIGIFDIKDLKTSSKAKKVWRISTIKSQTADEYAVILMDMFYYSGIKSEDIKWVAAASVVPSLNYSFKELSEKYLGKKLFFVNSENCAGLKFAVKSKKQVGADRIANSVAAFNMFGGGIIVIDFGTATTFDCIDLKGRYLGGAIALGPAKSAQALSLKTAQLPHVETKKVLKAIGVTTEECIQAGLYFGYIGLIKEILERSKKEMKVNHIIATGGLADMISGEIKDIEQVCPDLTLNGIRLIWEKSRRRK
ncbi:MAG: type III pantothenate kinase [Elusimicrobiota bacterium]|jgi:type III pantothenate kinase|nr:type III pantothenate kinase [Elusimicrobiota bacterium]